MCNWRERVVAEALTWDLTPYHHQGAVKGAGVDCARFPAEVYANVRLAPRLDPRPYAADWHMHRGEELFKNMIRKYMDQLPKGVLPQPGDLALFRFGRCHSHAAIVIAWPRVIHAVMLNRRVVIEDISSEYAVTRLGEYYTFEQRVKA